MNVCIRVSAALRVFVRCVHVCEERVCHGVMIRNNDDAVSVSSILSAGNLWTRENQTEVNRYGVNENVIVRTQLTCYGGALRSGPVG